MVGMVFQRPSVWKWGCYPSLSKPTRTHYTLSYNYSARRDPIDHPVSQFSLLFFKSADLSFQKHPFSRNVMCRRANGWASLVAVSMWDLEPCPHSLLLALDSPGTLGLQEKQQETTTDLLQSFHFIDWETEAQAENTAMAKAEHLRWHSQTQNPGLLIPGPWALLALHWVGHPDFVFLFDRLGPRTDLLHRPLAAFTARNTTVQQDISSIK